MKQRYELNANYALDMTSILLSRLRVLHRAHTRLYHVGLYDA